MARAKQRPHRSNPAALSSNVETTGFDSFLFSFQAIIGSFQREKVDVETSRHVFKCYAIFVAYVFWSYQYVHYGFGYRSCQHLTVF